MSDILGTNAVLSWVTTSGTVTLNTDYRQVQDNPSVDLVDVTAGADSYKTYKASLKDGQLTWSGLAQAGGTALLALCGEGTEGTITLGEEGTATGKPKTTFPAISLGVKKNVQYAGVIELSVTWQQNGTRSQTAY